MSNAMAKFKLKRALKHAVRRIRLGAGLLRENRTSKVARYVALSAMGRREVVSLNIGGEAMSVRTASPDVRVARSCLIEGELSKLKDLVKESRHDFIIDAGGHIGAAAVAFAKMFPGAIVVSLEPSRENFALLQKNTETFSRIIPINKALLGSSRTAMLSDRGTGEWGFTLVERTLEARKLTAVHTVAATTVDEILRDHGANGVDILKLDIEGSEKDVLSHCVSWMPKVDVLIVELHDRIVSGCSAAHDRATKGMRRVGQSSEKVISIRDDVVTS